MSYAQDSTDVFIRRLKRKMEEKKLGISEIIERSKLHKTTVYDILNGSSSPTLRTCDKLAQAVRTPMHLLLKDKDEE